jgi:hypothetical protein
MFVIPLARATIRSAWLKTVAIRSTVWAFQMSRYTPVKHIYSFSASLISFVTTATNGVIVYILHGNETIWVCFGTCAIDVRTLCIDDRAHIDHLVVVDYQRRRFILGSTRTRGIIRSPWWISLLFVYRWHLQVRDRPYCCHESRSSENIAWLIPSRRYIGKHSRSSAYMRFTHTKARTHSSKNLTWWFALWILRWDTILELCISKWRTLD